MLFAIPSRSLSTGDPEIQGFGTRMSAQPGETMTFKISTISDSYRVDIYRVGYYNGDGARKVATLLPFAQVCSVARLQAGLLSVNVFEMSTAVCDADSIG